MATEVVTFLPIVTRPYYGWSDKLLVEGTDRIAKAMNKNPYFPTLDQQVQDYAVSAAAFSDLYTRAKFKDANVIAQKNDARKVLIADSIALGNAIEVIAAGDLTQLISTAVPLKRLPQRTVLPTPENLVVENGTNMGEIMVKIKKIMSAISYNFYYTADPLTESSVWICNSSSTSKFLITGQKVGSRIWVKVEAIGPRQESTWSVMLLSPFVQERVNKK